MKYFVPVLFLLLAGLIVTANATPMLHVSTENREMVKQVFSGNFDIASIQDEYIEIVGWPDDIARMQSLGISYTTSIDDLESFYQSRLNYELDDMGGYPTLDEIIAWTEEFCALYPEIVSGPDTVGYTFENRPMLVIKMSDNPGIDEEEPELFLNSAIHCREVITPLVLMNFMEELAEGYGTEIRATDIVNNREIWFMLNANPDGYYYNEVIEPNGGGMWRKNKRTINNQLFGVDLNRNFTHMWGYDNQGSSGNPNDATYRGESAGSEPETQVIMDFVNSRNFVACINYHSYSNLILHPFGYETGIYPENYEEYLAFTEALNAELGWTCGTASDILYVVNGDACDWMGGSADNPFYSFVFEVGGDNDGFWPATARIPILVEEQVEPLYTFCEIGGNPELLMPPPAPVMVLPDTVSGEFDITWIPLANGENVPVNFDLEVLMDRTVGDGAEEEGNIWTFEGFSSNNSFAHGGNTCYWSDNESDLHNTMTTNFPIHVNDGDEFTFWARYSIEEDFDYAYAQVTMNGIEFTNLQGNLTTNFNPNGANQGNGITGSSNDWVEATFPLDDFVGEDIYLRLVYNTDTYVNDGGIWIDDINLVNGFEIQSTLATEIADTFYTVDMTIEEGEIPVWYRARARDAQDDVSNWAIIAGTIVVPPMEVGNNSGSSLPEKFSVGNITPNPFNPVAQVSIGLPETANVQVQVYDILGRSVYSQNIHGLNAGYTQISIDGSNWSSGLYFVRVQQLGKAENSITRKALLIK